MTHPDKGNERERLAQLYAGMTEGELERLAEDASSLTELARVALKLELSRRGLPYPLADSAEARAKPESVHLVTIRQFRDLPEALLVKGILDSAGISCNLDDENIIRMDWFISNALGGIKLRVREEDVEPAVALLNQDTPAAFNVDGVGEYNQPSCPYCKSMEVSFQGLKRRVAYTTAFLGVPLPLTRRGWKCDSCGHEWQEGHEATH
ncbi:MAG: DUF2007 domain-containing protein [Verrucomicrobiales bacterium]|nr:DUF2007 domain-containing protein [Verrucomicrobiales bacterium]